MADMTVANTILQQLGGRRFLMMTGARDLTGDTNCLIFKLPARLAKDGIRAVRITLTPLDVYEMKFLAPTDRLNWGVVAEFGDIYADQLQTIFTKTTGLATSL